MRRKRKKMSEEKVNEIVNEILAEDREKDLSTESTIIENNPVVGKEICECMSIAENSSRFTLRVMEAMRSLQRGDTLPPTSTIEDIVHYIETNYRDDGDLYAQVRTALNQVSSQGFAIELCANEYLLIGPVAMSMNRITCSKQPTDCLLSSTTKSNAEKRETDDCDCDEFAIKKRVRKIPTKLGLQDARQKRTKAANRYHQKNTLNDSKRRVTNEGIRNQNAMDHEVSTSDETSECSTCNFVSTKENSNHCTCDAPANETNASLRSRTHTMLRNARDEVGGKNFYASIPVRRNNSVKNRRNNLLHTVPISDGRTRKDSNNERLDSASLQEKEFKEDSKRIAPNYQDEPNTRTERERQGDRTDSDTDETTSRSVEDLYLELNGRNSSGKSKSQENELKRWIKRCKKECEKQKMR